MDADEPGTSEETSPEAGDTPEASQRPRKKKKRKNRRPVEAPLEEGLELDAPADRAEGDGAAEGDRAEGDPAVESDRASEGDSGAEGGTDRDERERPSTDDANGRPSVDAGKKASLASKSIAKLPDERPRFVENFPSDPELDVLVAAFVNGNYALVRERAPKLAKTAGRDDVRQAALELRRRIDPDRMSLALMAFAVALLVVLAAFYWTHKHV